MVGMSPQPFVVFIPVTVTATVTVVQVSLLLQVKISVNSLLIRPLSINPL